jgi:hypothetical protein
MAPFLISLYCLTPAGIEQKARLIARFFQRKETEYEVLQAEIKRPHGEVRSAPVDSWANRIQYATRSNRRSGSSR